MHTARVGLSGYLLYEFDGTNKPAVIIENKYSINMTTFKNKLYNTMAKRSLNDCKIINYFYIYDGTNQPIQINSYNAYCINFISPYNFTIFNDKLYFNFGIRELGTELWEFDGINNIKLVDNINLNYWYN